MNCSKFLIVVIAVASFLSLGCGDQNPLNKKAEVIPIALRDVSSERLSYRYEGDVPPPTPDQLALQTSFERSESVQLDFDSNRPTEILERTIPSPGGERILAVYRKGDDVVSDFRLDMYSKEGKLLKKVTHKEMAVQFPDTIVWAPDGSTVAFVSKVRGTSGASLNEIDAKKDSSKPAATPEVVDTDEEKKKDDSENTDEPSDVADETDSTVAASPDVITFRTEQIYTCAADGSDVKPLTQVEGLMYFYFTWAPDSSALAALAAVHTEWRFLEARAKGAGQHFIPRGRLRLIEKNGRERKLDDKATPVHPVWSPDSAKVAIAIDREIRIFDGIRAQPTQAAIPLRNDLLISSRTYEKTLSTEAGNTADSNSNSSNAESKPTPEANTAAATDRPQSALPDANRLVSFNPIVDLAWTSDDMLYFETGFVRNYLDDAESVRSYMRWHRLILSAQAVRLAPTASPAQ